LSNFSWFGVRWRRCKDKHAFGQVPFGRWHSVWSGSVSVFLLVFLVEKQKVKINSEVKN
jgi:hypothetical protein